MVHLLASAVALTCTLAWAGKPQKNISDAEFTQQRQDMVARIARHDPAAGVKDPRVIDALREVPRHLFVSKRLAAQAYADTDLSIGKGQTIRQPFIVAYMIQTVEPLPGDKVLEIGTGSGYEAAILSRLAKEVYTVEIVPALARQARQVLQKLGYANVQVRAGDGYRGWPEHAPFDAIIVTCAPDHIPEPLVEQLAMGGRLVIPVGVAKKGKEAAQALVVVRKTDKGMVEEKRLNVSFGPMKGEATRKSKR